MDAPPKTVSSPTNPTGNTGAPGITMPLGLFVFTLLYGGMTVLAGVLAYKQVQLWPTDLAVESGIFAFLLLVVISSTIAQLYGRALAQRIVWWGFLPLLISSILMQLVLNLPASPEMLGRADDLAAFERVHNTVWRVWAAGPAAYIVSLLLNVWIFDRLKGSREDTTIGLMVRGAIASALSQAVDSVIFITLAFYGLFPIGNLLIGQIIAKVVLSLVLVPFLITLGVKAAKWLDARSVAGQPAVR
ncbi:queuosine precursor transporter [Erythrobacter sp.]|uniref:queuosine precursor transporter n=1 Tax=Erythrobacter sp. TaxID=1042 RepID=UPI003C786EBA